MVGTTTDYLADGLVSRITVNSLAGKVSSATVARRLELWHVADMRNRLLQRWFVVLAMLAMLAMLGAIAAVPLTSTVAAAMAGSSAHTPSKSMAAAIPCHKPAKPCPHCPQKYCLDMSTCLLNCPQVLSPPVAGENLHVATVTLRVFPASQPITRGSLIPPLLRPPSV